MDEIRKQVQELRYAAKLYDHYPLLAKMLKDAADTIEKLLDGEV